MPVEILELVVKANIAEESAEENNQDPTQKQIGEGIDKKILVEEIVEQVLAILHRNKER